MANNNKSALAVVALVIIAIIVLFMYFGSNKRVDSEKGDGILHIEKPTLPKPEAPSPTTTP